MTERAELGHFLKSRRARTQPEDLGLPRSASRRTPGLRREELATLVGMSVDYYTRLEQGRDLNPSDAVLAALASTLGLDADEREHLFTLGRPIVAAPVASASAFSEDVRPGILALIDSMDTVPAMLLGRRMDVLAWNPLAARVMFDFASLPVASRNMVRFTFLDPRAHALYVDWDAVAAEGVAHLRVISARHPGDQAVQALVGELAVNSEEFRILWARHDVHEKSFGSKLLRGAGGTVLRISYETLVVGGSAEQYLVTYSAQDAATRAVFAAG